MCEVLAQFLGRLEAAIALFGFSALVQQGPKLSIFGYVGRGVVEEAACSAPPRSVPRQQVLTHSVVVVVHSDPGTKRVLGERQAGLPVALLETALVPHVIVFWLVCRETERRSNKTAAIKNILIIKAVSDANRCITFISNI